MKKIVITISLIIFYFLGNAQNVAINNDGSIANTSSILDVKSTTKGILIPRMSKAEKNGIITPTNGLLIYQNVPDSVGFHYYNGTAWVWLQNTTGAGSSWSTTGNAGTDTSVNFIGTIDNMPLAFKVNNKRAGIIEENIGNTAFGFQALKNNQASGANAAFGTRALEENISGGGNTALGYNALRRHQSNDYNTAIGANALGNDETGGANVAVGVNAMSSNISGFGNNALGNEALQRNSTGNHNTAFGDGTLKFNISGHENVALGFGASANQGSAVNTNTTIGSNAGNNNKGNSTVLIGTSAGFNNTKSNIVAIGDSALFNNGTGAIGNDAFWNTAIGSKAMYRNTTGNSNTAVGFEAHRSNTVGSGNTAIGFSALFLSNVGADNNTAIGREALSNNITGNSNVALGYQAGFSELGSSKLYIENSNANKDNALIYGDFAADSLNLNAKVNIKNYTRLGQQVDGAPAIKMKKLLIPVGPAVDNFVGYALGSGITDAKVIGVQVMLNYATPFKIPPSYNNAPGYEYDYQIQNNQLLILLKPGNSANIGGKPIVALITYEE